MDTDNERKQALEVQVVLQPIVRGLDDLAVVSLIQPSQQSVTEARNIYRLLGEKLRAFLLALDAADALKLDLESIGYPVLPTIPIRSDVSADFAEEEDDLAKAFGVFTIRPEANKIVFGTPVIEDKPAQ